MDQDTIDEIVDRLHANPELVGAPFDVVEDDSGIQLDLDGTRLATIPADLEARTARSEELERRYGIALFEPEAFESATADELETWLYYDAGFKDTDDPITEWETARYEARLPEMAAIIAERVQQRLASPFVGFVDAGSAVVESLDCSLELVRKARESTWSGVPVELESSAYHLVVDVDLPGVDDELLSFPVDSQMDPLTDDVRADAERMVPPRCIVLVADALTVRWDEESTAETASMVERWLDRAGEAVVAPALDRPQPGERPFGEGMTAVADRIGVAHDYAVAWREAYFRRAEDP